ncbi:HTH_Tnp_Tc3_2 domain-containing protein [Trichonephila clavipes]|nr:HTH_Tnp_Tc3_2 domain-containing protein [Trichonephila clavipes]
MVKEDIEDVSSELGNGVKGCTSWMKHRELNIALGELGSNQTSSSRRHGGGRVRSTKPAEDRYIVLSAKRSRRTTAQQVANQFLAASGKQISQKTVARRLRGGGLYAHRPVVCVPLTRQHRTARLQWCREHHNWTEQD